MDLRNTKLDCRELTPEQKMTYVKACIGDDLPHKKMYVWRSGSKVFLMGKCRSANALYCDSDGMASFDCSDSMSYFKSLDYKEIKITDIEPQKPVYTKDMAGNGELPPVGCECEYFDEGHSNKWIPVLIKYSSKWGVVAESIGAGAGAELFFNSYERKKFRPIDTRTDQEKLIDDFTTGIESLCALDFVDRKAAVSGFIAGFNITRKDG